MNYIVLDLEWNQSPSGKADSIEQMPFEIIEIGAVKLDEEYRMIGEFHRLIKPQVYKTMHFKISEVTHMKIGDLCSEGELFPQAARSFFEWCEEDARFCTWGSMDLTELQRNMAFYRVPNPFSCPLLYYDVQKLYCLGRGDGREKPSLDLAVEQLGIRRERPFHRALDDAYYTGLIMANMDFQNVREYVSVDYYRLPENREQELYLTFPDYTKYVSRTFETRDTAMEEKQVTDVTCLRCRRLLRKKIRWFPFNQRYYYCLAWCPEHGYVKGKIRIKKSEEGKTYIVKTVKMAGHQDVELLYQKKEDARRKRSVRNRIRRMKEGAQEK